VSEIKDGGLAFPIGRPGGERGMKLRDYFAAQALGGLIASDVYMREIDEASKALSLTGHEEAVIHPRVVSRAAYRIADAMLSEREKNQ
jgi:hypothetical protein